jgi:flavin-binding protein dodecin
MSVAKIIELSSRSETSFEDAIRKGVRRASQSLRNVRSAWVKEQSIDIEDGEIAGFRVNMMVTFVLGDGDGDEDDYEDEEDNA